MSVLVDAFTVVVRVDTVDKRLAGGTAEFLSMVPNATYRSDGVLAAVSFMFASDADVFVLLLQDRGLEYIDDGNFQDIAVLNPIYGPTAPCVWLRIDSDKKGNTRAHLIGFALRDMAVPKNWQLKRDFRFFQGENVPDFTKDPQIGLNVTTGEGTPLYGGECYPDGDPRASMLRARPRLVTAALEAVYNVFIERKWQALAVIRKVDAVFHIAMRYENQLGLVFVEPHWGETCLGELSVKRRERLMALAKELHAVPIVARCKIFAPIFIRSQGSHPTDGKTVMVGMGGIKVGEPSVEELALTNLLINGPLNEKDFDLAVRIDISDWELQDFAIQVAREMLEREGFHIDSWDSGPGTGPHILATKADDHYRIVVGAARYPERDPIFDQNRIMACAESSLVHGGKVAKYAVAFANSENRFDNGDIRPLFRGEGAYVYATNLEPVDPSAIFADRTVRIFVSSTFREFGRERDILLKRVLPELQRRASERGVSASIVDLRWGVTREDTLNRREVLSCLREIDNAYPFFLALIGEHYGSPPAPGSLDNLWEAASWLAKNAGDTSITELEIRYAMLRSESRNSSALIYGKLNEAESRPAIAPAFLPLVQELRLRGYPMNGIGAEFEADVTERLWALITRHYPEMQSTDTILEVSRRHRQYGLYSATALPQFSQPMRRFDAAFGRGKRVAVTCDSSWEASALAGSVALGARRQAGVVVFDHYLPLGSKALPLADCIERLNDFVRRTTGHLSNWGDDGAHPSTVMATCIERLDGWAAGVSRRVLIVLAETDLLGPDEQAVWDGLQAQPNVDIVLTRTVTDDEAKDNAQAGFAPVEWGAEDGAAFVGQYLRRLNKAIDHDDVRRIASHSLSVNMSFPRFVCDQLASWSTFKTFSRELDMYLSVTDISGLVELMQSQATGVVEDDDWRSFLRVALDGDRSRTESELCKQAGIAPDAFRASMTVVAPLMDHWAGRIWVHRGPIWSRIGNRLLAT